MCVVITSSFRGAVIEKLTFKNNFCCPLQTCWISGLRRLPDASVWGGLGPHQHCQRQLWADAGRRQRRGRSALHQTAALSWGKRLRAGCLGYRWVECRAADSDLGWSVSRTAKKDGSRVYLLHVRCCLELRIFFSEHASCLQTTVRFPSVKRILVIKATGKCSGL